jgi:hypothetical protein
MAIDNIFPDNYKFSPVYNGLPDHDAQLLTIKDTRVVCKIKVPLMFHNEKHVYWH